MITPNKMTVLNDRVDEFLFVWDKLLNSPVASDHQARAIAVIGILNLSQSKTAEFVAPAAPSPTLAPASGPSVKCAECNFSVIPKVGKSGKAYSYCPKCKTNRKADGGIFEAKQ